MLLRTLSTNDLPPLHKLMWSTTIVELLKKKATIDLTRDLGVYLKDTLTVDQLEATAGFISRHEASLDSAVANFFIRDLPKLNQEFSGLTFEVLKLNDLLLLSDTVRVCQSSLPS